NGPQAAQRRPGPWAVQVAPPTGRPVLRMRRTLAASPLGNGLVFHLERGVEVGAGAEQLVAREAGTRVQVLAVELVAEVLHPAAEQHHVGHLPVAADVEDREARRLDLVQA